MDIAKVYIHWDAKKNWNEIENTFFPFVLRSVSFRVWIGGWNVSIPIVDFQSGFSALSETFRCAVIYRELTLKSYTMSSLLHLFSSNLFLVLFCKSQQWNIKGLAQGHLNNNQMDQFFLLFNSIFQRILNFSPERSKECDELNLNEMRENAVSKLLHCIFLQCKQYFIRNH